MQALVAIYVGRGDDWRAAVMLEQVAPLVSQPTRAQRYADLGQIYEERLRVPLLAERAYERACASGNEAPEMLRALARLHSESEQWARAGELLLRALPQPGARDAVMPDLRALARALVDRPLEHARAAEILDAMLATDPQHRDALALRAELTAYGQDFDNRVRKLRDEAVTTRDKSRAAANYLIMAQLFAVYGNDPKRAREHIDKCLLLMPGHAGAMRVLERQLVAEKKERELAELLANTANKVRILDKTLAIQLLLRAAAIWDGPLATAAEADSLIGKALELDPGHIATAFLAAERWLASKRYPELTRALERFAQQIRESALEAWARKRLWQLYSGEFPNPTKAAEHLERLAEIDPLDHEIAQAQEGRYRTQGNWSGLIKLLSAESTHLEGAPRAQAFEEQADLWIAQQRRDEAYEAQSEALDSWPTAERARKLVELTSASHQARTRELVERASKVAASDYRADLEKVLTALGAVSSAAGPNDPLAAAKVNAALKSSLAEKIAVFEGLLGSLEGAALSSAYQEMLALDPDNRRGLRGLADAYRKEEKWSELAEVLRRLATEAPEARELAKLCEARLGRPEEAASIYARLLDSDAEAPAALERLVAAGVRSPDALLALAEHTGSKQPKRAAELWAQLAQQNDDHVLQRRALLAVVALEAGPLALRPAAVDRLAQALLAHPEDAEVLALLQKTATGLHVAVLQRTLEQVLTAGPPPDLKATLAIALAQASEKEPERLANALYTAFEADPARVDIDKLDASLRAVKKWPELDQVLAWRVEGASAEAQPALLHAQGELRRGPLGNLLNAKETYERLLAGAPQDQAALQALIQIAGELGDTSSVVRLLEERAAVAPQPGPYLLELGTLYAANGRTAQATTTWVSALATPQAAQAVEKLRPLSGDKEAMEALLTQTDDNTLLHAHRALAALGGDDRATHLRFVLAHAANEQEAFTLASETFLAEAGADPALQDQLEKLANSLGKKSELLAILRDAQNLASRDRSGQLSFKIASIVGMENQRPEEAIDAWRQAVAMDPNNLEALNSLDKLLRSAGKFPDLVEVLRLKQNVETGRKVELGLEVAQLYAGQIGDSIQATAEYEQLTQLAPQDARPWHGLADVYIAQKNFQQGAQALVKELELTPESPERTARLLELAKVYQEGLNDPLSAAGCLSEVLRVEPGQVEATERLEHIMAVVPPERQAHVAEVLEPAYAAQNNLAKLFHAREVRITHTPDPAVKRELLIDTSRLQETKANDAAAALTQMSMAFRLEPSDERVRAELERLGTKAQNLAAVAAEYEAVLPVVTEQALSVALRRRLAEMYEKQLNRPQDAVTHLQAAAELAGGDAASLEQVARLLRTQGDKPQDLADVLAKQVALLPQGEKDQRLKLLLELGDIRLNKLADKLGAVNAYQAVVALDPKNANAFALLDRLLVELDRRQELVEVLIARRDLAGASDLGVEINVRLGDLHREHPSQSLQFYKAALQRRPQNAPALAALEALLDTPEVQLEVAAILEPLHTAKQDYAKLAKVLEVRLSRAQALTEKKGLIRRIGDIFENRLNQKDRAFFMALKALREDPADMGIRMWIEKLAQEVGSFADLANAYVEQAQKAEAPLALQFHRRAAALFFEKVNDAPMAIQEYREVLSRDARDLAAHVALEKLYGQTQQPKEQSEILVKMVDLNAGQERKLELLGQAAALQEQGEDFDAALATRRRQLQLAPEDGASFDGLGALYQKLGRPEEWAKALDDEIKRIGDKRSGEARARKMDLLYRRGLVTEQALSDPSAAAKIFDQILTEDPNHKPTIDHLEERVHSGDAAFAAVALERVYAQTGDWRKFIDVLEAQLSSTPDHESRKALLIKIGHTYQSKLNVPDMAFLALSRAFSEDSSDQAIRGEIEGLAQQNGNYGELVELYASEVDAIADQMLKLDLTLATADLYAQKMKDAEQAITWYRRAQGLDANNARALVALDQLYSETEKWSALTEVLDLQANLAEDQQHKTEFLLRLGLTWGDKMFEPEAAIRALSHARQLAPTDVRILGALERYFGETKAWDEVAQVLRVLDTIETQPREDRVRVRLALGMTLAEQLHDPTQAIEAYKGVLELDRVSEDAIATLEQLFRQTERYQELADHLKYAVENAKSDEDRSEFNRRLAEVMADHLGNVEEAISSWNAVLKTEPRRTDALRALIALYGRAENWAEQAEAAKRLIPLVQPAEGKVVRFARMEALAKVEGGRAEALLIGREILSAAPHTPEELLKLADLFEVVESWDDAAKTIDRSVELQPNIDDRLKALRRSADIYLDRLNRPTAAVPSYEKILELNPGDKGAFDQVRKILRNAHEWRRLVATDEGFISQYQGEGREELLSEIRDIHDRELGQKDLAFIAACRVFREFPTPDAANAMEKLAGETNGFEELSAVYEDALEEIDDVRAKIETNRRLAKLYAKELNEPGAAEEVYERLLILQPGDPEALDAIAAIRSKQGRYEDQVNALEEKLGHAPDVDAKKSVLRQIASVWDAVAKDTEKAIATHKRVLDLDPSDRLAIDALSAIYEREDKYDALIQILQRAIDLAPDPRATIPLREKTASLYEGRLNDPEASISAQRQILELDPQHLPSLEALERLYTALNRWRELIEVFEREISLVQDNETKIKLFSKAGAVFEEHFEDRANALVCYDNVLALDPNHVSTLRHEERLLKETKEWEKLIQVLSHHAQLIGEPREIVKFYIQIGDIFYRQLARVDKAEEMYNAARALDPNAGDALNALGKLYERSGNWFQSLEMLQREADALKNEPKAVDVYFRMGKINENMLMDSGAAKGCYQRALQINPSYVPALAALKDIAANDKDWDTFVRYMVEEAEATEDPETKTELLYEAGKFFLETRNDPDRAEKFFSQALEVTPDYIDAARPLAELFFRKEDWPAAESVLEVVVEKLDAQKDLKELGQKWYRLGYLADKQGNAERALQRYEKSFDIDSTYLPTLEGLGQAYIRAERWEDALKAFNAILVHHRESLTNAETVDLYAQTGDMYSQLSQFDKARRQYEKALEVEPQHGHSLRSLADMLEKVNDFEGSYDFRNRYVDVAPREERAQVLLHLAQLSRDHLHDPYRAIDALIEAQKLEPQNIDVLDALVQLYTDTKQVQKVADLTEQLIALTTEDKKKTEYGLRLGDIFAKDLKDLNKSLKYYNMVLDSDPTQARAFEAIEHELAEIGEWKMLEENYRAMIARLPATARQAKAAMFRTLADLYSQVLKEPDNAITAFEVVSKLDPGNASDQLKLASLYGEKPELRAKAVGMQQEILKTAANPTDALRELRKLYHADKKFDRVYWVCHALAFLKQANDEEKKIIEHLKKGLPPKASRPLTDAQVRDHLLPPILKGAISDLVSALYKYAPDPFTKPIKDLGLKKKEQLDVKS